MMPVHTDAAGHRANLSAFRPRPRRLGLFGRRRLGMSSLTFNSIVVVPIRTGVGFRLGANAVSQFTPSATWNPSAPASAITEKGRTASIPHSRSRSAIARPRFRLTLARAGSARPAVAFWQQDC